MSLTRKPTSRKYPCRDPRFILARTHLVLDPTPSGESNNSMIHKHHSHLVCIQPPRSKDVPGSKKKKTPKLVSSKTHMFKDISSGKKKNLIPSFPSHHSPLSPSSKLQFLQKKSFFWKLTPPGSIFLRFENDALQSSPTPTPGENPRNSFVR